MQSLNKSISIGVMWNFIELIVSRGANTLFTLFLARILAPEHFGLIAMVTIVFEFSNAFIDSGLGTALVRSKTVTRIDLNTVFFSNLFISILTYIIIFYSAPLVAQFYSQNELISLIRVLGLIVLVNAARIVQVAIFTRKMDFKTITKTNTTAVVISGVLAVISAWAGLNVWSLVIQMLSSAIISTLLLWFYSDWRPTRDISKDAFIKLFSFSKNLLVVRLLEVGFSNSYLILIGRMFSAEVTGLYFFARKVSDLISTQLTNAIQKATLPGLSTIQKDSKLLKKKYQQIIQISVFLIAPVMGFLAAISSKLIPWLFGDSWAGAIPYLQLLCIIGALYPLHAINVNILFVKGRSDLFLKADLIKKAFITLAIISSLSYGVIGLLIGQIVSSVFSLIPNTYYSSKLISYSFTDQAKDIIKPYMVTVLSTIITYLCIIEISLPSSLAVILGITIFIFLYLLLCSIFKVEGFNLILSKINQLYRNRKAANNEKN